MMAAYGLGVLITTGFHNPKKFPKPEQFMQNKPKRVLKSLDEQRAFLSTVAKKVG